MNDYHDYPRLVDVSFGFPFNQPGHMPLLDNLFFPPMDNGIDEID